MAKQRYIQADYWEDPYIDSLPSDIKLIHNFLITNKNTSLCGVYKILQRDIGHRTGLNANSVNAALNRLEADRKIFYVGGWVYVRNFIKYVINDKTTTSPTIIRAIEIGINEVPADILTQIFKWDSEFKAKYSKFLKG